METVRTGSDFHRVARTPLRSSLPLLIALASAGAASFCGSPVRAQLPPASPPPAGDPRKGPRLEYKRGPVQCQTEEAFRSEIAIWLDGADHLAADSPDVARVWFEKVPGGYQGTLVYMDAEGKKRAPEKQTSYNCELLGRWVAWSVSHLIPPAPDPPPPPPPQPCPVCAACSCPACPACGTSQPPRPPVPPTPPPWRMDLTVGLNTYVMMTSFLTANVGPAVGVAGEVRGEVFGIAAEFRAVLPGRAYAREPIPGTTSSFPVEFDLSQFTALLVPCARYKYFVGCGVAQLGFLFMQSAVDTETLPAYGFGPRVGFEVPFAERFTVFGFGEVLFNPSQGGFQFDLPHPSEPDGPIPNTRWREPVASGFFGAGLSVKFK